MLKRAEVNRDFIDLKGTNCVTTITNQKFELLKSYVASFDDLEFIFDCRYAAGESSFYLSQDVPDYYSHRTWFMQTLQDTKNKHIIYEVGGVKCGYVRLDFAKKYINVNIYVDAMYRGRGLAELMLNNICQKNNSKNLHATVHSQNFPSLNAFLKTGFSVVSRDAEFLRLKKC